MALSRVRYRVGVALTAVLVAACGTAGAVMNEDMPSDLAGVVSDTLELVEEVLPAHGGCLDGLIVSHAWELDDRAEYRPVSQTVVLRVPETAENLAFSLVHEIAHHLEFACPAQEEIREAFLIAQGHPPTAPWFEGDMWETTPSEQFATALAEHVTGREEKIRPVDLTDESRQLVADWVVGN